MILATMRLRRGIRTPNPLEEIRLTPKTTLAALAAGALLVSVPAASAQAPTDVDVGGGTTTIKLSKKAAKRLKAAGAKLTGSKGAKKVKGGVRLTITGGEMDPVDASPLELDHKGTLTAKRGKARAKITGLTIDGSNLTATAGSKTITLGKLKGGTVSRQGFESTDVKGATVSLTKGGAKALNKLGKGKKAFKKGALGKATIDAQLDEALIDPAGGGSTVLRIDPSAAATFSAENVSISPIAPATAGGGGSTITFPIIGGTIDVASLSGTGPLTGQIQHSGGILFKDGDPPNNELPLGDLNFDMDTTPAISVIFGAGRVDAAELDVSAATKAVNGSSVTFNGSVARINAASAAVLNAPPPTGFGMSVSSGDPIGSNAATFALK